jgi:type I restriction enzyme R subunit
VQAERYARGLRSSPYNFAGLRAPFLYATNGEVIWFHDVRQPLNRSRRVADFHTPAALRELLERDIEAASAELLATPNEHAVVRPYQREANTAVERAIADHKRHMLVAMATGTGKTFTLVNQTYRLMKSGVAQRVLFLVDRRALAAQAVRAFASFEAEPGQKFDKIYEVYSSRFQREDFGEEEKFDPKLLLDPRRAQPGPRDLPGNGWRAIYGACRRPRCTSTTGSTNAWFGSPPIVASPRRSFSGRRSPSTSAARARSPAASAWVAAASASRAG